MSEARKENQDSGPRWITSYSPKVVGSDSRERIPVLSEYMDSRPPTLKPDMHVYDAIDVLLKRKVTGAAVVDDSGVLVGILSEKDCLRTTLHGAYDSNPGGLVSDYMTTELVTVSPDTDMISLVNLFLEKPNRRVLVTEGDRLVGQVTRRDVLREIQKLIRKKKNGSFF